MSAGVAYALNIHLRETQGSNIRHMNLLEWAREGLRSRSTESDEEGMLR